MTEVALDLFLQATALMHSDSKTRNGGIPAYKGF
jgi:hypothetical protein